MKVCPCCHFATDVRRPAWIRWPLSGLLKCQNCGHLWQENPSPFEYGKEYVNGYAGRPTLELSWVRLAFLWIYKKDGRVLDIGYGDGEFIRQASRAGFFTMGYDAHADDIGVPVVKELKPGVFDIVTMFDSFEHMADLDEPFKAAPSMFVVTVPWLPEGVTDETIRQWRHYKPNEHLHYFTEKSLRAVFSRHGYGMETREPIEDIIRKNPQSSPNTMTFIFKRVIL